MAIPVGISDRAPGFRISVLGRPQIHAGGPGCLVGGQGQTGAMRKLLDIDLDHSRRLRVESSMAASRSISRCATSRLLMSGQLSTPSLGDEMNLIVIATEDAGLGTDVIGDDQIATLSRQLLLRMFHDMFGFGRKANDNFGPLLLARGDGLAGYRGSRQATSVGRATAPFFIFSAAACSTRQSATAAAKMAISQGSSSSHSLQHVARRLDRHHLHTRWNGQRNRPGNENRLGAKRHGGFGDGIALLARGVIGDDSARDRSARASVPR